MKFIAQGQSNTAIATSLTIGVKTVEFHVSNLLKKLEVRNRTGAAIIAQQRGLLNITINSTNIKAPQ